MKSAIIVFPGSNCDRDALDALEKSGSNTIKIWHEETSIPDDLDLIIVPGGFSYGDYLRSGAMASISPVMNEVKKLGQKGVNILGICNGFQILTEAGMLDGVLLRNKNEKFICGNVNLRVENNQSNFTANYQKNQTIKIPIAHMDGCYFADESTLKSIEDNDQVAFRYCNSEGEVDKKSNPNGSLNNIAGVFNENKNILGMMPHPERAIESQIGLTDGLIMFESLIDKFK
ncbi:MAG: phosphoribosylformylglycinamidine synthase [Rickettsiales bacterium]|jgi:phosphoribosylformylglycinamidine synthase